MVASSLTTTTHLPTTHLFREPIQKPLWTGRCKLQRAIDRRGAPLPDASGPRAAQTVLAVPRDAGADAASDKDRPSRWLRPVVASADALLCIDSAASEGRRASTSIALGRDE